jgi:hypothetical protein
VSDPGHRQRLAAILAADVAGYSRLTALDDSGTITALDAAGVAIGRNSAFADAYAILASALGHAGRRGADRAG